MKSRVKVYGLSIVVLLVAFAILKHGSSEISAGMWHLRHGFHTEVGDTRIWVPISYEADDPHGLPSLWISRFSGVLWHGSAFISIDFHRLPSPESMERADALLKNMGKDYGSKRTKVGERSATFAGRPGKCVEYNSELRLPAPPKGYAIRSYEIQCRFDPDVSVMLLGSPKLKDDFYKIIHSAESLTTKN